MEFKKLFEMQDQVTNRLIKSVKDDLMESKKTIDSMLETLTHKTLSEDDADDIVTNGSILLKIVKSIQNATKEISQDIYEEK
jgi:hypothetical protein